MFRRSRPIVMRQCACALVALSLLLQAAEGFAQTAWTSGPSSNPIRTVAWHGDLAARSDASMIPVAEGAVWSDGEVPQAIVADEIAPAEETWISPHGNHWPRGEGDIYLTDPAWDGSMIAGPPGANIWHWQLLPDGLIYRSYQASVHEPRLSIVAFSETDGRSLWDGSLGGRVGLLRYGTCERLYPQGWQLDVEAAAMVRLTLDEIRDFETADYRVGVPLTYGLANWQFKFAVYHLSSHLGDEFAIANPGSLDERINYVRDALVLGASYYPHPVMRLYSEAAYAVNVDGGAEPWEFQFGTELSQPGPTGPRGTPFLAVNGHLREEHEFGGDVAAQTGWLWRGQSGQTLRTGLHYFNGKSSQYQTFDDSEEQIGFGVWYDY